MAREWSTALRSRLTRKQAERRDLRFQIEQLKQQLEQMDQSSTVDMEIWHEEALRLSSQIQTKLEAHRAAREAHLRALRRVSRAARSACREATRRSRCREHRSLGLIPRSFGARQRAVCA